MAGELVRRDLGALDDRRHSKDERVELRAVQFSSEVARLRQRGAAQVADEKVELLGLLGSRVNARAEAAAEQTRLLARLHPDNPALEMDMREVDQMVRVMQMNVLAEFGRTV